MENVKEILQKLHKKYKNYEERVLSGLNTEVIKYKYEKKENVVLGLVLKNGSDSIYAHIKTIYLFDNKKKVYYLDNDNVVEVTNVISILTMKGFSVNESYNVASIFSKLFSSLSPYVLINYEPRTLRNLGDVIDFYQAKEPAKTRGEVQRRIDKLISSYSLKNYDTLGKVVSHRYHVDAYGFYEIKTGCKLEYIEKRLCVVRMFFLSPNPVEFSRIYIDDKRIIKCIKNNFGEWISAGRLHINQFDFSFDVNDLTDDFKNTRLWYYKDFIRNYKDNIGDAIFNVRFLLKLLREPIFEKLYKIGFLKKINDDEADIYLYDSTETLIKIWFGYYEKNEKNVHRAIGLNNYQCNRLSEKFVVTDSNQGDFLQIARYMFSNDLAPIDNNSFDRILDLFIEHFNKRVPFGVDYVAMCNVIGELKSLGKSSERILTIFENFYSDNKLSNCIYGFIDLVKMVGEIKRFGNVAENVVSNIDFIFKDDVELRNLHDAISDLYNGLQDNYMEELFKTLTKKWKRFLYDNDKFVITYPLSPADITNEGVVLRHCVKSYIDSISREETTILFLRKKEEPDKPYFTIEVTKNNKIRQIHGFSNCNLKKKSEEYKFVKEWARKNNLDFGSINEILGAM